MTPAPTPADPTPVRPARSRRVLKGVLFAIAGLVALGVLIVWAAWVWLGTQSSVNTAVTWAQRWVSELQMGAATGSLRQGVTLERVQWMDGDKSVSVNALTVTWRLQDPWWDLANPWASARGTEGGGHGTAQPTPVALVDIHADRVAVTWPEQAPPDQTPVVLPESVRLPLGVQVKFGVDAIEIKRGHRVDRLTHGQAHYRSEAGQTDHVLGVESLRYGDLHATAHARIRSEQGWPIEATVEVKTPATLLASHLKTQHLSASIGIQGHLVDRLVDGEPQVANLAVRAVAQSNGHPLLNAQVGVEPWASQPLREAHATFNQWDLAAWLLPDSGVPRTRLSGTVALAPAGEGAWGGDIALEQAASPRLPAAKLRAHLAWVQPRLEVRGLDLVIAQGQADQAWLRGDATWDTGAAQLQATLQGQAPGVSLTTALTAGTKLQSLPVGQLALKLSDAGQFTHWFNRLAQRTQLVAPLDLAPTGQLSVDAAFTPRGQVNATLLANQLAVPLGEVPISLSRARVVLADTWQDLKVSVDAQVQAPTWVERADMQLGTRLRLDTQQPSHIVWRDLDWRLAVRDLELRQWLARSTSGWSGQFKNGQASGSPGGLSVGLESCAAQDCAAKVSWQAWSASAQGVDLVGQISHLTTALAQAVAQQPPASDWRSDLVLGGRFQARLGPGTAPSVALHLSKTQGDVSVRVAQTGAWQALGLQTVQLQTEWAGRELQAQAQVQSELAGSASAQAYTPLEAVGWGVRATPNAPLRGQASLRVKDLAWLGPWLPPTLQVGGTVQADFQLAGTQSEPRPTGVIEGRQLFARHKYGDFDVGSGQLKARLDAQGLSVERLTLHGVTNPDQGGYLNATGRIAWGEANHPSAQLALKLVGFQATAQADKRVRISGDLRSAWERERLMVKGALVVDKADITLSKFGAPSLGDDVVIVGRQTAPPPQALPLALNVDVNLGHAFKVSGFGLTTGLRGQLHISGPDANNQPIVNGEVTTVDARYKAYGQDLVVKRGRLLFAGRPDAPQLDILAVRALTEPEVGVQVQGPMRSPKVELYASEAMADSEKLSWLLLGHPSARGGSESALIQNAVLALVGDTNKLIGGVDEFSIAGETKLSDGTTRAAQFTVGKQLSDRLYTSYTRSVASIQGLLSVYLKLSSNLSVRAQTGEYNNIDLVWSRAYD